MDSKVLFIYVCVAMVGLLCLPYFKCFSEYTFGNSKTDLMGLVFLILYFDILFYICPVLPNNEINFYLVERYVKAYRNFIITILKVYNLV